MRIGTGTRQGTGVRRVSGMRMGPGERNLQSGGNNNSSKWLNKLIGPSNRHRLRDIDGMSRHDVGGAERDCFRAVEGRAEGTEAVVRVACW